MSHLMMEGAQESMLNGMSRPVLFSFPIHRRTHEPMSPRFVSIKPARMGGRADINFLKLWLENEEGKRVQVETDKNFVIDLLWRKWKSGSADR